MIETKIYAIQKVSIIDIGENNNTKLWISPDKCEYTSEIGFDKLIMFEEKGLGIVYEYQYQQIVILKLSSMKAIKKIKCGEIQPGICIDKLNNQIYYQQGKFPHEVDLKVFNIDYECHLNNVTIQSLMVRELHQIIKLG